VSDRLQAVAASGVALLRGVKVAQCSWLFLAAFLASSINRRRAKQRAQELTQRHTCLIVLVALAIMLVALAVKLV